MKGWSKSSVAMAALCIAYLLVFFQRQGLAPIANSLTDDLGLSATAAGALGAAFFYAYAFAQVPSGMLVDAWGPRKALSGLFALAGAGGILFALATGIGQAFLGRVVLGIGMAVVIAAANKAMSTMYTKSEYAAKMSLFMAVGGLGAFLASSPLAWLASVMSWRVLFLGLGIFGIIWAGVLFKSLAGQEPPSQGQAESPDPAVAEGTEGTDEKRRVWYAPILKLWSFKQFRVLIVWEMCVSASAFSLASLWGGVYYPKVHGMSMGQTGHILSMSALALILGAPFLSWLSEKVLLRRKILMIAGSIAGFLACASMVFVTSPLPIAVLFVQYFAIGMASNGTVALYFSSVRQSVSLDVLGIATGFNSFFLFLASGVMQMLTGAMLDMFRPSMAEASAIRLALSPMLLMFGMAVLLSFFLPERQKES